MKISKTELQNMIRESVQQHLKEFGLGGYGTRGAATAGRGLASGGARGLSGGQEKAGTATVRVNPASDSSGLVAAGLGVEEDPNVPEGFVGVVGTDVSKMDTIRAAAKKAGFMDAQEYASLAESVKRLRKSKK